VLADAIAQGHTYLADWLFLIGAILFGLCALFAAIKKPDPTNGALLPAGLTAIAVAWLVL
jgi:hypothetical protein